MSKLGLMESPLPNLVYRGKVRDTHEVDDKLFLMVATDRISAFDVVLPTAVPDKGAVLCQISYFWFDQTEDIVPNHFVARATDRPELDIPANLARQAMVVRRAERIDVECVIRGYITGSAWSEYRKSGTVQGMPMPAGLQEGDKFPEPLFTPTTKAEVGHDENMTMEEVEAMVGVDEAKARRHHGRRLQQGPRHRPCQGHRHCRHEDGVRLHRRRADAHRRAADPGLQPVLGRRGLRARQVPAQLRQAVRQGLARRAGLGRAAGSRDSREDATSRPTSG